MSDLGARLRQARESQGLSLAQASVDTRILQQSLIALEEGAYQRLPGDVVIRGFIRNYAQYLGLSGDELIELYRRERGVTDKIQIRPVTTPPHRRTYVLPSFFGVFFVTIALVGLAYVSLSAVGRIGTGGIASVTTNEATAFVPPPSPLPSPSPTVQRAVPATNKTTTPASTMLAVVASATPRPAGGVIPVVVTPTVSAPILVEVSIANQRADTSSWVRVQADGKTIYEGIMSAGQRQTFEAQRRIVVRAGNPPAVLVTVNGMEQGVLGQVPGQPVNWEWPPN
ncbi:helix-turn-helix domain-containing protein [Candidatus Oscillochloris fontis]|uniref:helix-turn-helix domain-containing protein n=1 Tax=Candidatus Oscillochloris fontis TaxID=2496868 RepID=UPI00101E1F5B|nr:RodZ domain-containing protein [Candidatus Oscillochloris fontis]